MTTDVFALALATVARDEGIDADHRAVRVLDQAGWHTSPRWAVPEGSHGVVLPSSSPELHPAERLWPLGDEPVANRAFPDVDTLRDRPGEPLSHPGGRPGRRSRLTHPLPLVADRIPGMIAEVFTRNWY